MHLKKYIGCLLATGLATTSAFAAEWFANQVRETLGTGWTVPAGSWAWNTTYGTFKNWDAELVYAPSAAGANTDETVTTTVKFTAMDSADAEALTVPDGAKAGLTLVEAENGTLTFWGVVNTGSALAWQPLTGGSPTVNEEVAVKVALFKVDGNVFANYTVGGAQLAYNDKTDIPLSATETTISSIAYKGVCDLYSLAGMKWSNDPSVPDTVVVSAEGCPASIAYNHQELKELGVNADDEVAVKAYFTTAQANGYKGWVNYALGIDGTVAENVIGVESNVCEKGSVALDYGFVVAEGHTVTYSVDKGDAKADATVEEETAIHSVAVIVDDITVQTQDVGVMVTGKEPTAAQKTKGEKVFDIVAVPFESFKGLVTVANLLNTAELTTGDTLYILNGGKYDTFELQANGTWKTVGGTSYSRGEVAGTTLAADEYTLTQGQAIWIERNANSKIVFTGKGEAKKVHKWVWSSGEYSLVANPTINDFTLSGQTFGANGDMIIVEDVANPQQFEKVGDEWGEWTTQAVTIRGKTVSKLVFTAGGTIKAGIGFWYYNPTGAAVTITFGTNGTNE